MAEFKTLPEMVQKVVENYSNPSHLNYKYLGQWEHISTESFLENVRRLALGLKNLGLRPGDGFGILADPSPHWIMVDLAAMVAGAVTVPMFANISSENLEFEISDSNIKYLYIAKEEKWQAIQSRMGSFSKILSQSLEITAPNVVHYQEALKLGDELSVKEPNAYTHLCQNINEDDVATIIYTSGSTGTPKGVEITHRNLVSQIKGAGELFPLNAGEDKILSCLPLAHIFERMVVYYYVSTGCSIYFADDIKKVGDLLREIHPTVITLVPRLLEKVHAKMLSNVQQASGFKKKIAALAFRRAAKREPEGGRRRISDVLYDHLVYSKLRSALGGKLNLVIVGGAAMSKPIGRFFLNIGLPLYEGYGLTESSPVLCANYPGNRKLGTVGKAYPGVDVQIGEKSEILAKGPNIMRGYHNNDRETGQVIDENGYLHTGDVGQMDNEGFLTITGRIKELFKTSSGKYVSPVPIEQALQQHEFVDMAAVIAEAKNFVTCLLFPDFEKLQEYKERNGYDSTGDPEFLQSDFVSQEMSTLLGAVNKSLNHWEKVQKFRVVPKPISIEGGQLTPTMKVRRHVINKQCKALIDEMYAEAKS